MTAGPAIQILSRVILALMLALFPVLRASATTSTALPLGSPSAPFEEEEEKRGEAKLPARSASLSGRAAKAVGRSSHSTDQFRRVSTASSPVLNRAAPLDPFRNGLGSPFRC